MALSIKSPPSIKIELLSTLAANHHEFSLRHAMAPDKPLLRDLFAMGRYGDLAALPPALLEQQWVLRQQTYSHQYPNHLTLIVLKEDEAAGMVTLDDGSRALHILELVLQPQVRSQGLGSALLRGLQAAAAQRNQILSLHVLPHNPALRLYYRLGFVERGGDGMQLLLEWTPDGLDTTQQERSSA